jgi:hypothetical protein
VNRASCLSTLGGTSVTNGSNGSCGELVRSQMYKPLADVRNVSHAAACHTMHLFDAEFKRQLYRRLRRQCAAIDRAVAEGREASAREWWFSRDQSTATPVWILDRLAESTVTAVRATSPELSQSLSSTNTAPRQSITQRCLAPALARLRPLLRWLLLRGLRALATLPHVSAPASPVGRPLAASATTASTNVLPSSYSGSITIQLEREQDHSEDQR